MIRRVVGFALCLCVAAGSALTARADYLEACERIVAARQVKCTRGDAVGLASVSDNKLLLSVCTMGEQACDSNRHWVCEAIPWNADGTLQVADPLKVYPGMCQTATAALEIETLRLSCFCDFGAPPPS